MFLSALLFSLLPRFPDEPDKRRAWILCCSIPILIDVLAPWLGVYVNSTYTRIITGMVFGGMLSWMAIPAVTEFWLEVPWKSAGSETHLNSGGIT